MSSHRFRQVCLPLFCLDRLWRNESQNKNAFREQIRVWVFKKVGRWVLLVLGSVPSPVQNPRYATAWLTLRLSHSRSSIRANDHYPYDLWKRQTIWLRWSGREHMTIKNYRYYFIRSDPPKNCPLIHLSTSWEWERCSSDYMEIHNKIIFQ